MFAVGARFARRCERASRRPPARPPGSQPSRWFSWRAGSPVWASLRRRPRARRACDLPRLEDRPSSFLSMWPLRLDTSRVFVVEGTGVIRLVEDGSRNRRRFWISIASSSTDTRDALSAECSRWPSRRITRAAGCSTSCTPATRPIRGSTSRSGCRSFGARTPIRTSPTRRAGVSCSISRAFPAAITTAASFSSC